MDKKTFKDLKMFKKEFMYFCAMVLPKFCDTKDLSKGIINVIITFLDDLVERSMLPPKVDLSTFYGIFKVKKKFFFLSLNLNLRE